MIILISQRKKLDVTNNNTDNSYCVINLLPVYCLVIYSTSARPSVTRLLVVQSNICGKPATISVTGEYFCVSISKP